VGALNKAKAEREIGRAVLQFIADTPPTLLSIEHMTDTERWKYTIHRYYAHHVVWVIECSMKKRSDGLRLFKKTRGHRFALLPQASEAKTAKRPTKKEASRRKPRPSSLI
jgi:hypothetical protein